MSVRSWLGALVVLGSAGHAMAQSEATSPESGTKEVPTVETVPDPAPRELKFRGFVSTAVGHNFTYPGLKVDISGVRAFDYQYDTFSIDVAQLSAQYLPINAGDAGFRIDLNSGYSIPRRTGSAGSFASLGIADFDLLQAYASYIFPVGRGLRLDAGKFVTHLGAELIEGVDGYNFNYSRSILFFNAIPFAHTGLRLSTAINDLISVMVMAANGADNVIDNNTSKALGAQVVITPSAAATLYANYLLSANQPDDNHNFRHYVDLVANVKASDQLTLNVNFDFSTESFEDDTSRTQLGVAGIVNYAFNDVVSAAIRGEYWASGIDNADGDEINYMEVTLTPTFTLGKYFAIRPEVRFDSASSDIVWVTGPHPSNIEPSSSQVTAAVNFLAIY